MGTILSIYNPSFTKAWTRRQEQLQEACRSSNVVYLVVNNKESQFQTRWKATQLPQYAHTCTYSYKHTQKQLNLELTLTRLVPPFSQPIWYFFSGVWKASNSFVTPRWPSKISSSTPASPESLTQSYQRKK